MRHKLLVLAATVLASGLAAGCQAVSNARAAVKAERAGEDHLAYDLYCEAAQDLPSDPTLARGMARTAPEAFRYRQRRAREALNRDDYETAWKHLMRALMIRPNDEATALMIRGLEANHADAVAGARRAYLLDGAETLVVQDEPSPSRSVQSSDDGRDYRVARTDRPTSDSADRRTTRSRLPSSGPSDRRAKTSGRGSPASGRTSAPPARNGEDVSGSKREPEHKPTPRPAPPHRDSVSYLATVTVSREDRRYAREAETVDGIFIKVKDTDPDPDADADIYLDRKRIRRIDNWCVGQHVTVVGRSGQRYVVVLRDITDSTETIRVGVRRAR